MNAIAVFISLLFATPFPSWTPQTFSSLWSEAQTQVVAQASPTPAPSSSPSPIALRSPVPIDDDGPGHREPPGGDGDGPTASPVPPTAAPSAIPVTDPQPVPTVWTWSSGPATPVPSRMSPSLTEATPGPVASPSAQATIMPAGTTYSSRFVGNTPFHHRVDTLILYGATVLPQTVSNNLWAQGFGSGSNHDGGMPMWNASPGDPTYAFQCPAYGGCGIAGMKVQFPPGAVAQCAGGGNCSYDYHITSFAAAEVDGWGGSSSDGKCALSSGVAHCMSGAKYNFTGSGLSYDLPSQHDGQNQSNGPDAGGYAVGIGALTYRDRIAGPLNHAFTIVTSCEDNKPVYPSTHGTDFTCTGSGSMPEPATSYGDLVALKRNVDPSTMTSNPDCLWLLQGFQKLGAYVQDNNGGWGIDVNLEPSFDLSGSDRAAWQAVQPNVGGKCLSSVPAADIEVLQLNSNGTSALPPVNQI